MVERNVETGLIFRTNSGDIVSLLANNSLDVTIIIRERTKMGNILLSSCPSEELVELLNQYRNIDSDTTHNGNIRR